PRRPRTRMHISPPPLVPEAGRTWPRSFARPLLVVALLALAGVAHLTGSSLAVTSGLVLIGLVALAMHVSAMRETMRLTSLVDATARSDRAEIENLADRMWEMQESEERFHGLIDALGDIVVHRDRE